MKTEKQRCGGAEELRSRGVITENGEWRPETGK
jgi:hypothetical protein